VLVFLLHYFDLIQLVDLYHPFRQKHSDIFFFFWLILVVTSLCYRVILCENRCNHFSINMDFVWLVTWSGVKKVLKKRYRGSKNVCGFFFCFETIIINQVLWKTIHVFAEIAFFSFFFFLLFFLVASFVCESSSFEIDDTHFPFEFLFFGFDLGAFDALLLGLISFKKLLICILTKFQHVDYPYLGYFWNIYFLGSKKGIMEFYWYLGTKKHGHISFWILVAWFSKRLTLATDFNDSQHLSFFFLFLSSYLLLRLPFAGFQSNGLLFLCFLNSFEKEIEIKINHMKNPIDCPNVMFIISFNGRHTCYWDKSFLFGAGWRKAQRGF